MSEPSFEAVLAGLRAEYVAQWPARFGKLMALASACREEPGDAAALEELHRTLHTIAGTAGSLGLAELGRRAREIECVIDGLMAPSGDRAGDMQGVELQVAGLRGLVPGACA